VLKEWLTVAQVAERYAVTEAAVLSWVRSGELRAVNCARHAGAKKPRWRISGEALAQFEAARTPAAPAPRVRRQKPPSVIEFYR
jgi:hypothetical protein